MKGHRETATYRDGVVGKSSHTYPTSAMADKYVLRDDIGVAAGIECARTGGIGTV